MSEDRKTAWQHPASQSEDRLLSDCDVKRTRGSGPGGQHRNKVETAIVVSHRPTGILGQASERRSQNDNRREAIWRLRLALATGFRQSIEEESYESSPLWKSRVSQGRISISGTHEDFPSMLAEAMDVLGSCDWDAGSAAKQMGCTSSQLIKFLKKEPSALAAVNRNRQANGQSSYK